MEFHANREEGGYENVGKVKFARNDDRGFKGDRDEDGGRKQTPKKGYTAKPFNTQKNYRQKTGDEGSDGEDAGDRKKRRRDGKKKDEPVVQLPQIKQKTAEKLDAKASREVGQNKAVLAKTGFAALGLDERLCEHLEKAGYSVPTRIQEAAIPMLARRKDTLVKSETGSGKTLAYLLPVIHDLLYRPERLSREAGTHAIVIAPTRELAVQIEAVFKAVTKPFFWLVATTLMGGENKKAEKSRLRKGAHVVIGTPGRIKDHMETTQAWHLDKVRWFIMDEADRLLDLGFEESMKSIYKFVDVVANESRDVRCNVLVSATLNKGDGVDTLAKMILRDPQFVGFDDKDDKKDDKKDKKDAEAAEEDDSESSDSDDSDEEEIKRAIIDSSKKLTTTVAAPKADDFVTPTTLKQLYVEMASRHRLVALASFLRLRIVSASKTNTKCKIVVFVSTCAAVEFLHKVFSHTFWPDHESGRVVVVSENDKDSSGERPVADGERQPLLDTQLWKLHGNMPQKIRTATYFEFCKASEGILFCTDVAARGLDMPAVDWIIQYDPPEDTDDYVHRVGRTARIGHSGQAVIFLVQSELGYLDLLRNKGIVLESVALERLLGGLHVGVDKSAVKPVMGPNGRPLPAGAILQKQLETMVQVSPALGNLAREAYISFFRSYAAYPKELKHIFHPKRLHFGEVAHSFALIEKPTDIGKKATAMHEQTMSTIAPLQAAKMEEDKMKKKPKSLNSLARKSGKKGDLQEFM